MDNIDLMSVSIDKPIATKMSQYIRNFIKAKEPEAAESQTKELSNSKVEEERKYNFQYQEIESDKDKEEEGPEKKKRGRPKRVQPNQEENKQKETEKEKDAVVKKRRRRTKIQIMEDEMKKLETEKEIAQRRNQLKASAAKLGNEEIKQATTIKKKKGRPPKNQPIELDSESSEEEESSELVARSVVTEPKRRGRPPKSKPAMNKVQKLQNRFIVRNGISRKAPKETPRDFIQQMRRSMVNGKEKKQERMMDVEIQSDSEDQGQFEILQIKRKAEGIIYLVQKGQKIRWARKQELLEEFAGELVSFYQQRLLAKTLKGSLDNGNLFIKYE